MIKHGKLLCADDQVEPERVEADTAAEEDPPHVKDMNTESLTSSMQIDEVKESTVFSSEEGGEKQSTTKALVRESSPEGDLHALPKSSTSDKLQSASKKVAFMSIKNLTLASQSVQSSASMLTSNAKAFHFMGNESDQTKDDKPHSLASIFSNVNPKDSIF